MATLLEKPMLATATDKLPRGTWIAEEKYDGHRLLVRISEIEGRGETSGAIKITRLQAWSRLGNTRPLPKHLADVLVKFPVGLYDGELIVPAGYSSSVTELTNSRHLQYVMFDVLELGGEKLSLQPWGKRRQQLETAHAEAHDGRPEVLATTPVILAATTHVKTWEQVEELVGMIWDRGGEGVILKDVSAPYIFGKRTKYFLKVKELNNQIMTVVGFCPTQGEVMDRGQYASAVVRDEDDNHTVVKTLDDAALAELNKKGAGQEPSWFTIKLPSGKKVQMNTNHPYVGRKLAIEYQARTPDGSYRHPRWDHWVEE